MLNWTASEFAIDVIEFLKSRTMPNLPHIGIIGSKEYVSDPTVDIEDLDFHTKENQSDLDNEKLTWDFIPNKFKTQLTILPTDKNINTTKINFYIRLNEGSYSDVIGHNLNPNRNKKYLINEKQLYASFRHYEICINSPSDLNDSSIDVIVDGKKVDHYFKSEYKNNNYKTQLTLNDKSKPFLNYNKNKPQLVQQVYEILIEKEIAIINNKRIIKLSISNNSPKTKKSKIPIINYDETTDDVKDRILKQFLTQSQSKKENISSCWDPILFHSKGDAFPPSGSRYGHLLEFEASESISSEIFPISDQDMSNITNSVFDDSDLTHLNGVYEGKITFRDHVFFNEEIPKMKNGEGLKNFFDKNPLNDILGDVLFDIGYKSLTKFQEDAINEILNVHNSSKKDTVLISIRAGGGKTEAFMIPLLDLCLNNKLRGVKGIIFYPTKALANDQASRFIKILYHVNKIIERPITLGILHGDIPTNEQNNLYKKTTGLPLICPKCQNGLLQPDSSNEIICNNKSCAERLNFVLVHNREQIYSNPPDILITNPDILIRDMMIHPNHHSIFGMALLKCNDCGRTYFDGKKTDCMDTCTKNNYVNINMSAPSFLIFDEIHLFKGIFGINSSFLLSRLEYTIKKYEKQFHNDPTYSITKIGSSATISNPNDFTQIFFNTKDYSIIPKSNKSEIYYDNSADDTLKRYHIFVMPYAYASDSTVSLSIKYMQDRAKNGTPPIINRPQREIFGEYLQTLAFVNTVNSSNSLIPIVRRATSRNHPDLKIGGHTTDYDMAQRSQVEYDFNNKKLHIIFATSTLEVGVDFKSIHCIILNGFPYSFNDYLQRIGRGSRKINSLIMTVCQNWKPIDHFYYSYGKKILKSENNVEPVVITRNNAEAIKKHIRGAALDFITRAKNLNYFSGNDSTSINILSDKLIRYKLNKEVFESCGIPENLHDLYLLDVDQFVAELINDPLNDTQKHMISQKYFEQDLNTKWNLASLRCIEPNVIVEEVWSHE